MGAYVINILLNKWGSETVTGDRKASKPNLVAFKNTVQAVKLLKKHIDNKSKIAVHCDVDVDGIGSGYILKKFLKSQGANNNIYIINKEREHGVSQKHVDFFNKHKVDLIVILDSSSNEIETIKQFNCDVLVVDHHEINHGDTYIKNENEYIIVNNMIDNMEVGEIKEWISSLGNKDSSIIEPYKADERMSGGLVLYELLRVYQYAYDIGPALENLRLYQWVGITLFSDSILLANERNQWYIEKSVQSMQVEGSIKTIIKELNPYKSKMDKSLINYTLAPIINKAIRAGASAEALDIVMNRPAAILSLNKYKEEQEKALGIIRKDIVYREEYIMENMTGRDISRNYYGVIASRICGDYNKNVVVYVVKNGIAEGSFRGRYPGVDYRNVFVDYHKEAYAQGHKVAFGFKVREDKLKGIMEKLQDIENVYENRIYLTAGDIDKEYRGINHIDDIDEFKRQGNLWKMAVGNSKVSSMEQIEIVTSVRNVRMISQRGKLYMYEALGIECKAFEIIESSLVSIYPEYSSEIEVYLRNYKLN